MAMNRMQFQAGLSMAEFLDRYGSEDKCEAALAASRWPDGFRCPACGTAAHGTFVRGRRRYWQCAACRLGPVSIAAAICTPSAVSPQAGDAPKATAYPAGHRRSHKCKPSAR